MGFGMGMTRFDFSSQRKRDDEQKLALWCTIELLATVSANFPATHYTPHFPLPFHRCFHRPRIHFLIVSLSPNTTTLHSFFCWLFSKRGEEENILFHCWIVGAGSRWFPLSARRLGMVPERVKHHAFNPPSNIHISLLSGRFRSTRILELGSQP